METYKSKRGKYTDLRNKSIFDFTRDEEILQKIFLEEFFEEYKEDPETVIKESADWLLSSRIGEIVDFAKLTNNQKLYRALKAEFRKEFPNEFRKAGDKYWYD